MRYYLRIILLVIIILEQACAISNDIDIEIPEQIPAIVVEGYLTPGYPMEITIERNNLLDDELILQTIWNARVYIICDNDSFELKNIFYKNKNRNLVVNYRNDILPVFDPETNYKLYIITAAFDTLTAFTKSISQIHIDSVKIENTNLSLSYSIQGLLSGYVRLDIASYSADSISGNAQFYSTHSNQIVYPLSDDLLASDSLEVRVFHISKEYFDYRLSQSNAINAYFDPFLTPEKIKSNIYNGIGIFTCYTMDKRKIYLKD